MAAAIGMSPPRSRSVSQASDELFLDPVSKEPMLDSVMDECGHTFDRSTIEKMVEQSKRLKLPIICPLGREEIDVNTLRPNRLVNEASRKYHVFRKDSSDNKEDEDSENLSMNDKLDVMMKMFKHSQKQVHNLTEEVSNLSKRNISLENRVLDLTEEISDLKEENVSFREELHKQKKKNKKSKSENKKKEKELLAHKEFNRNVLNMSRKERFEVFFGSVAPCCDHLKTLKAQMESKKVL